MTTVAVLADPPVEGQTLPALTPDPLDPGEATTIYTAMLRDVCRAIEASGADLLVNYRPDDHLESGVDSEAALREALVPTLEAPDEARFEAQVGTSVAGRVGNTITHLLERESVATAAAVEPTAALLARQQVDSAAMKLRSSEVVLGPTLDGRVYYAGFSEPIDFEAAFDTPAVETLTTRAGDAGLGVDFLPTNPVIERPTDLPTALPVIRAREQAGRVVPERTTACLAEFGLRVRDGADGPEVVRA